MNYDVLWWLQISILDPANLLLLFSGGLPGNSSGIASLKFADSQALKDEPVAESTEAEAPDSEQLKSTVSPITVLYAVNDEATIAVLDGATGECLGSRPVQPEIASKTLCIDVLGEQLSSFEVYNHVALCLLAYEGLCFISPISLWFLLTMFLC